jgi:hypothetical protein
MAWTLDIRPGRAGKVLVRPFGPGVAWEGFHCPRGKARRETRKLNARADRAETYAADTIDSAVASIDEAEDAIHEAAVARIDTDAAQ